jgi:hypothetical protein
MGRSGSGGACCRPKRYASSGRDDAGSYEARDSSGPNSVAPPLPAPETKVRQDNEGREAGGQAQPGATGP